VIDSSPHSTIRWEKPIKSSSRIRSCSLWRASYSPPIKTTIQRAKIWLIDTPRRFLATYFRVQSTMCSTIPPI
jgi:hypothetical protein